MNTYNPFIDTQDPDISYGQYQAIDSTREYRNIIECGRVIGKSVRPILGVGELGFVIGEILQDCD